MSELSFSCFVSVFAAGVQTATYVFLVIAAFLFAFAIIDGIYLILSHSKLTRVAGTQRQIKLLEIQMGAGIVGVAVGALLITGFYLIGDTPIYFWYSIVPASIMPLFSDVFFNSATLVLMILIGLGLFISMLTVVLYYSRKLKRLKTSARQK